MSHLNKYTTNSIKRYDFAFWVPEINHPDRGLALPTLDVNVKAYSDTTVASETTYD